MAREIWLRTNRRFLFVFAIIPLVTLLGSAVGLVISSSSAPFSFWTCVGLLGLSGAALVGLAWRGFHPRLAYQNGHLEVYLKGRKPLRVPIDIVECFFLRQGPSLLPRPPATANDLETATLIVRLAESAQEWKQREVRPWLGQWCEGYITIRGTFCEPLSRDVAARLNHRLVEVHREVRGKS